jgi:hypothetical protein
LVERCADLSGFEGSRRPIFDEVIKMAMAGIHLGTTHGFDQLVG